VSGGVGRDARCASELQYAEGPTDMRSRLRRGCVLSPGWNPGYVELSWGTFSYASDPSARRESSQA
jgi:hypothetical protein